MSHLSILPTVLHDVERLAESLESFGLQVHRGGELTTPVGSQNVCLWVRVEGGQQLGWRQSKAGSLELVADLERVSRDHSLQTLLSQLTARPTNGGVVCTQCLCTTAPASVQ